MNNSTYYYPWSNDEQCIEVGDIESVILKCVDGYPLADIWFPPNRKCWGEPALANVSYNQCSPFYEGQSFQLHLLINPCDGK